MKDQAEKNAVKSTAKIYIAGTHVFRPNALEYRDQLRRLCEQYGFESVVPVDKEPIDDLEPEEKAMKIFYANEGLIRSADLIVADLNPFRGLEPDSGTVFECGFGYALGKRLYGYISDGRSMFDKLRPGIDDTTGTYSDGMTVENFGLPLNLMLSVPVKLVVGTFEDCLKRAREDFLPNETTSH